MLVEVHATAGFAIQRLRHESNRFIVLMGGHLGYVLDQHRRVAGSDETHHWCFDLRLSWPAHLVVVIFHWNAHFFQMQRHLTAQVEKLVLGWDGVVTAV